MTEAEPDMLDQMQAKLTEARSCVEQAKALRAAEPKLAHRDCTVPNEADQCLAGLDWRVRAETVRRAVRRGFLAEAVALEARARVIVAELSRPADPSNAATDAHR